VQDRPVLVFLHDGLGSTETWRVFPDLLADEMGLGAFGYDRWGYGRSAPRAAFPSPFMEDAAQLLPKVLAAAGINDYALIGHSDGGTIALLHAASGPPGLRAAVSVSAHVHGDPAANTQLHRLKGCVDAGEIPDWMFQFHRDRAPDLLSAWVETWLRAFDAGWDISGAVAAIEQPLLAIHGADDPYGLPGQIAAIGRAVPHAETVLLPATGHFPHLSDPGTMVRIVAEFLAAKMV